MKKLLVSTFATTALLLAGCSSNEEVASTEAGRIREQDLYEAMKNEPLQSGMTVGETVLQRMLIEDIFTHLYGDQVSDEDVQAEFEKSAEPFGNVEDYEELLEAQGIDADYVKENIRLTLLIRAAVQDKVEVTDEQLEEEYEANKPVATVQHILVEDEELANDLIAQLEDGADFAELVAEHSTDPGSVEDEGKYSFFEGQMAPEFEEAALALEVGETTAEPVQSDFGYHVIRRLELDYAPLEEQREELEVAIIDGYTQDQAFMTELVSELAQKANVIISDQELAGAMSAYMPSAEDEEDGADTEEGPVDEESTEEDATEEESTEEDSTEEGEDTDGSEE